jgi:hypothetical protein
MDIVTRYGLEDPGFESPWCGARFSPPLRPGPGAHPASCTRDTGSFPGVKRPRHDVDHPRDLASRLKKRVALYLCSPSGLSGQVTR